MVKKYQDFELRHYPAGLQIETEVRGNFVQAGNLGFGPLVRFISGYNKSNKSIAMTAPVIQQPTGSSKHLVRFVLPENMSYSGVPEALDPGVKVIEVPEHFAAVKRFPGSWSEDRFEDQAKNLVQAVFTEGLETEGSVYVSRFDPPWKPGFLKRNEVLIRVKR